MSNSIEKAVSSRSFYPMRHKRVENSSPFKSGYGIVKFQIIAVVLFYFVYRTSEHAFSINRCTLNFRLSSVFYKTVERFGNIICLSTVAQYPSSPNRLIIIFLSIFSIFVSALKRCQNDRFVTVAFQFSTFKLYFYSIT